MLLISTHRAEIWEITLSTNHCCTQCVQVHRPFQSAWTRQAREVCCYFDNDEARDAAQNTPRLLVPLTMDDRGVGKIGS
jgi:hypothetical protein